jgi:hypothetical protein
MVFDREPVEQSDPRLAVRQNRLDGHSLPRLRVGGCGCDRLAGRMEQPHAFGAEPAQLPELCRLDEQTCGRLTEDAVVADLRHYEFLKDAAVRLAQIRVDGVARGPLPLLCGAEPQFGFERNGRLAEVSEVTKPRFCRAGACEPVGVVPFAQLA